MPTIPLSQSLNNIGIASSLSGSESFVVVQGGIGKKASTTIVEDLVGGGVTDGDKGDITVASSGTIWTIDNNTVTLAKQADIATASFLGRNTASTGDPEVLPVATAKTMLGLTGTNSGDQTITLSGDVTGSGTGAIATTIADDVVTLAKQANIATASFIGRNTAATGDPEVLPVATAKTMLNLTGTNSGDQTITLTGDVTGSGTGSFATEIAADSVGFPEMANLATDRLVGRDTTGTGDPETLTVGGGLEFTGSGGIQRSALTGAVTASAGSGTTAIAAGAVGPTELAATAVTPGSYVGADITVDADGRLTSAASGTYPFSMSELFGMRLSNNATDPTNDIDITAGKRRDSTDAQNIVGAASTKRLDAAWAVGSGNGGLDTGSIANTTYHVFTIKRSDTGVVNYLFSTSATAPTMPTSYDYKRRIGSIYRLSAAIVLFTQLGDEFLLKTSTFDVNTATLGTSATLFVLSVPLGIQVWAITSERALLSSAGVLVYITSPDQTDTAPASPPHTIATPAAGVWGYASMNFRTNTSAQIRARSSVASTNFQVNTHGWIDTRGRDD